MKKYKFLFIIVLALFIVMPFQVSAMEIYVTKPSNENITVEAESSDTIEKLKEKIYQEDNFFTEEKQILIFDNKVLEEGRTLADYNIQKNSTIILGYTVNVVFDANGGNYGDDSIYKIDNWNVNTLAELIKPTREGYTFKGYYTEKTGGTKFEMILNESGVDGDMTFYAQWDIDEENPETLDSIDGSILSGTLSLIGLIVTIIYLKNRNKVRA